MIRRTLKYLVLAAMIGIAAQGNAGTATVTPGAGRLQQGAGRDTRQVGDPAGLHRQGAEQARVERRRPELVHGAGAQREDQGAAGQGLVPRDAVRRDRLVQVDSRQKS